MGFRLRLPPVAERTGLRKHIAQRHLSDYNQDCGSIITRKQAKTMTYGFSLGKGTVIRFQGKARCRVLNNLCTQDLRTLTDGQALETFVTDVKGRTFGHGIAVAVDDEAFFVTVPDQGNKLVPHFDRYIIREDAVVSDVSNDTQFWLFQDRTVAAKAFAISSEDVPSSASARLLECDEQRVVLLQAPWVGPDSILALVPSGCIDEKRIQRLGSEWIQSDMVQRNAWELARIEAFWPWYGIDMDDRHLPQEVNRDGTSISFNKGCYLGQETIARLDMLGKVQKKLVKIHIDLDECLNTQTAIQADGKEVGTICSAAFDPKNCRCVALAYVKRSHFSSGQVLNINGHAGTVC